MITPTPGRIVWFFPSIENRRDPNGQPLAAIVAKVLSDRCLNLTVCHGDGTTYAAQTIQLLQDADEAPETAYACWMPYQKGQAAKHDSPTPAVDISSVTKAIDELATGTQSKFEDLGAWLTKTFTDFEQRLAAVIKHPALEIPPLGGQTSTTAIGASDGPGANLTAEGVAAAGPSPNVV